MDIFHAMVQYGCFFTIGVEVHFSDHIKSIAQAVPDHLLLIETDNPGGLKWLNGDVGMPTVIEKVVEALAELRQSTPDQIESLVQTNFVRLITNDPWLREIKSRLLPPNL